VVAVFRDGGGTQVGGLALDPVGATERNSLTGLIERRLSGVVPSGTRSIDVTVAATHAAGPTNDALADNVKLTIEAPAPPPPTAAPENTTAPELRGKPRQRKSLRCLAGTWAGAPSFSFAWLRDGEAIPGRTGSTLQLRRGDVGRAIQCQVTATNAGGNSKAASAPRAIKPKRNRRS
jgi:hypothetical protein